MVNNPRSATAIHEAAHAVVSYLLDAPFVEAVLLDNGAGEVVPKCLFCGVEQESICDSCLQHYLQHEPAEDRHSREIEAGLWRSAAIAVAGEIGEECVADAKARQLNSSVTTKSRDTDLVYSIFAPIQGVTVTAYGRLANPVPTVMRRWKSLGAWSDSSCPRPITCQR